MHEKKCPCYINVLVIQNKVQENSEENERKDALFSLDDAGTQGWDPGHDPNSAERVLPRSRVPGPNGTDPLS